MEVEANPAARRDQAESAVRPATPLRTEHPWQESGELLFGRPGPFIGQNQFIQSTTMMDRSDLLADLRRRLSAGRGPDNDLDRALHRALLNDVGAREPWTASTDAALYLLVRVGADLPAVLGRAAAEVADRRSAEVIVMLPRALLAHGIDDIAA